MPALPGISRLQPGQASFGRRASAADFGAAQGAAQGARAGVFDQLGGAATQAVELRNRVREGANQARLARAAAEYSAARSRSVFEAENDTDLDTLEERFGKQGQELLAQSRKALPPELHQAFEDRVFAAEQSARLDVSQSVTRRRIGQARADGDEALRLATDEAARAGDPVRREQIRGQAVGVLEQLLESGVLDQAGFDQRRLKLDRGIGDADRLRALQEDPAEAFLELANAASPLAAGLSEVERLQERARARDELEAQLREHREAQNFERQQRERSEKEQADTALKDLDDLVRGGNLAGAQQVLRQSRDVLTADQYEGAARRLAGDGKEPKTVRRVYVDLVNRAASGASIRDEANAAYLRGELDQGDRDRIVKVSEDARFGPAVSFASQAMRQGLFDFDPAAEVRAAEVQRQVADWIRTNPDATADQVDKATREIVATTGKKQAALLTKPDDPGAAQGQVDIQAAKAALRARVQSGALTVEQAQPEIARLRELERMQQLQGVSQ